MYKSNAGQIVPLINIVEFLISLRFYGGFIVVLKLICINPVRSMLEMNAIGLEVWILS
jgi:hypothetical protein